MTIIAIILFIIGIIFLYILYTIKQKMNITKKEIFKLKESKRIIFQNAKIEDEYILSERTYSKGLSLIKNTKSKFELIPQAKICAI